MTALTAASNWATALGVAAAMYQRGTKAVLGYSTAMTRHIITALGTAQATSADDRAFRGRVLWSQFVQRLHSLGERPDHVVGPLCQRLDNLRTARGHRPSPLATTTHGPTFQAAFLCPTLVSAVSRRLHTSEHEENRFDWRWDECDGGCYVNDAAPNLPTDLHSLTCLSSERKIRCQ